LYGAIAVNGVVSCITLFDRACDISSSRPDFVLRLVELEARGGRAPAG
jgi:hypothetical protein